MCVWRWPGWVAFVESIQENQFVILFINYFPLSDVIRYDQRARTEGRFTRAAPLKINFCNCLQSRVSLMHIFFTHGFDLPLL